MGTPGDALVLAEEESQGRFGAPHVMCGTQLDLLDEFEI
jgi:hypothetical protein